LFFGGEKHAHSQGKSVFFFSQELKILVPLANLLREHIRITLNNVEVVAHTPASSDPGKET
jgi:hypothetical protein